MSFDMNKLSLIKFILHGRKLYELSYQKLPFSNYKRVSSVTMKYLHKNSFDINTVLPEDLGLNKSLSS